MKPESRSILFKIAIGCGITSIVVSLLSLFGLDIAQHFPAVWLLHLGIFVVWIPSVALFIKHMNRSRISFPFSERSRPVLIYWSLFGSTPKWFKRIALCVAIYAVLVLFTCASSAPNGSMQSINGVYILNDHGKISQLTAEQFQSYSAARTGLFSAFWILFYTAGALFWSAKKDPEIPLENLN